MSFYTSYPNIYNFIDVLLEVQFETYIKYRSNGLKIKIEINLWNRSVYYTADNKLLTEQEICRSVWLRYIFMF